jgi:ribulose-phosphate 3-epimerase
VTLQIAPSLLAADFARLAAQIEAVERGGADLLHVDVMDGHFVPNLTMGPVIVKSVRRVTRLPLDVHLMVQEPDRYLEMFAETGASMM